jgi:hypothetical protein
MATAGASVHRLIHRSSEAFKTILILLLCCCALVGSATAGDWSAPAQQLAQKIAAVTGPGAVAVTMDNRSSLQKKDVDVISAVLRADLEALGARAASPEQAAASIAVWLSENAQSYVWVAEIHQGAGTSVVVMVSVLRKDEADLPREGAPIRLHTTPLWSQEERILDVLILEEDSALKHIAVLDSEKVAIYRQKNGKWQLEQSLEIAHAQPWPRDLRGRMIALKDHLLDVYLPGVFCRSTTSLPLALSCRESDDPWPLVAPAMKSSSPLAGDSAAQPLGAFYSASRNFFTGALTPGVGKLTTVGKFYSALALPRDRYALWVFAGTDGQIHMVDGITDHAAKLAWGSDIASIKSGCGGGWQVLATSAEGDGGRDSVRAYGITDREPAQVGAALDFAGEITSLWTEARADRVIAVAQNRETGEYEAFRLAVDCSQ